MKKSILIFTIYCLPAFLGGLFILNQVFPNQIYNFFTKTNENNSLILVNENSLVATPTYEFNRTIVNLETSSPLNNHEIVVKKDYIVNFYPLAEEENYKPPWELKTYNNKYYLVTSKSRKLIPTDRILESYGGASKASPMTDKEFNELPLSENLAGFIDGTLIKYRDSAFVISQGKKVLIASAQVVDNLNYEWDELVEVAADEARIHSNAPEPLNLTSPHPSGTVLKDNKGNFFLVKDKQRIMLSNATYQEYFSFVAPLELPGDDEVKNNQTRTCILNNQMRCSLKLDSSFNSHPGNGYYFGLPSDVELKRATIKFTRKFSVNNIKTTFRKYR